jgi:L-amino acid N-acyltransferase YncA
MSEIRSAMLDDAREIARIYEPYVLNSAISFEEDVPDATEISTRIERAGNVYPWLVAADGDGLIGYAYGAPHRSRPAYRWSVEVSVYLEAAARGRGVGGKLLSALLQVLVERGFVGAFAGTTLPNPASAALFRSLGFTPVGIFRRAGFKLGAWHDVEWWQLALSDEPAPRGEPGSRWQIDKGGGGGV